MRRILDTSVGLVVLEFYGDGIVHMFVVDEEGWQAKECEYGDAEIAHGLFYCAGVPEDEAQRLEAEVLGEYRARGGVQRSRWDKGPLGVVATVGCAFVALWLLTILVVGLVTFVRWVV